MINLQKNKCGGQDAHSALIYDLKAVLAKHQEIPDWVDSLAEKIMTEPKRVKFDGVKVIQQMAEEDVILQDLENHNEILKQQFEHECHQYYLNLNEQLSPLGKVLVLFRRNHELQGQNECHYGMSGTHCRIIVMTQRSRILIDCLTDSERVTLPYSKRDWFFRKNGKYFCLSYLNHRLPCYRELKPNVNKFESIQELLDSTHFTEMLHYIIR